MGAKQSRKVIDVSSQEVQDVSSQDVSSQEVHDVSSQEVVDVSSQEVVDVSSKKIQDVSSQEVGQIEEPRDSKHLVSGVGCCSSVSRVVIDNVPQNPAKSSVPGPDATPEKV